MEDNMDEILMEYFQREERLSTEAVRRVNAALDKRRGRLYGSKFALALYLPLCLQHCCMPLSMFFRKLCSKGGAHRKFCFLSHRKCITNVYT